jgi:hypothetical protein
MVDVKIVQGVEGGEEVKDPAIACLQVSCCCVEYSYRHRGQELAWRRGATFSR